jgi:hypothetical protein
MNGVVFLLAIISTNFPYYLIDLNNRNNFLASLMAQKSASTFFSIYLFPILLYLNFRYRHAYCIILQNLSLPSILVLDYKFYLTILEFVLVFSFDDGYFLSSGGFIFYYCRVVY